jgi:hypothetical protein
MLKTEQNRSDIEWRVREAFRVSSYCRGRGTFMTIFEHGQWWIHDKNGAQYSVVDATGGGSIDGFDFEQVSEAEE